MNTPRVPVEPKNPAPGAPLPKPPRRVKREIEAILAEQSATASETAETACRCRVAPDPNFISWAELLKRSESEFHCRRLRRWLRASLVLNAVMLAAVAGLLVGLMR